MRYLLMICTDETSEEARSPEEAAASLAEYEAWAGEAGQRGVLEGGARLRPTYEATTVRVRDGEFLTSDGPFAETKEQIGGFFLIEAKDMDEACAVAARFPPARVGTVEVRPVQELHHS